MQRRRVVITGLGVLAPNGCGKETFWQSCLEGRSGVRAISRFDASPLTSRIAGEIPAFAPAAYGLSNDDCNLLDRGTQLALAAAQLALVDADIKTADWSDEERQSTGVHMGTAMASVEEGERLWLHLLQGCSSSDAWDETKLLFSSMPAAVIARQYALSGPCLTVATGCSAGADAIGLAYWKIQDGLAERMLAGGCDSAISLLGVNVFCALRALSTRNHEPEKASRPYDAQRDGFVLAEGAAVLLLEEREAALQRGAHIYAEIQHYVSNSNAYHMTSLPEDGQPLSFLLQQMIDETHLSPEMIGYINSHGSSTRANDVNETNAYKKCFGAYAYHIPVSSTKSLIGHSQGAASAIEILVTALTLDDQVLPPTINQELADPCCDLDYVPDHARPVDPAQPLSFALTHSSGFGGVNAALLLNRRTTQVSGEHENLQQYQPTESRRVVITGLGVVSPHGCQKATFWRNLMNGHCSLATHTYKLHDQTLQYYTGAINEFYAEAYLDHKLAKHTDRATHFVLVAADEALQDAGLLLEQDNSKRAGAVIANTFGGVEYVTQQIEILHGRGPRFMSPYTATAWLPVANSGQLSIRYGLQGYSKTPVNDLCGGLDALGLSYQAIKHGVADILLAGGCEAPLHPYALHVLHNNHLCVSSTNLSSYCPFSLQAEGLAIAEGAGVCVVEEYEHARRRGAYIYGEITGYAQTYNPHCLASEGIATAPDVADYTRALSLALVDSVLTPADIACLYLDGRAMPDWDAVEIQALKAFFGDLFPTLSCSVPRTQYGHCLAAAGVLDTISALLTLQDRCMPPVLHGEEPSLLYAYPPGLVHREAQVLPRDGSGALICARGLTGHHTVLAVRKI